jgi:aspartyl/asparaginyl-tRNA synthetase
MARLAPGSSLLGESEVEAALVDGWLAFGANSVDLSLQVQSKKDWEESLKILEQRLLHCTYLVGNAVTAADIRVVVSIYAAVQQGFWKPDGDSTTTPNTVRWYNTVTHQDWFETSLKILSGGSTSSPVAASSSGVAGDGVQLNGTPPAVYTGKYRRHRIRIKEVLKDAGAGSLNQTITVAGWARTIRKASSKLFFVELNDGSTGASLQCVLDITTTAGFDDCKTTGGTGASFQFVGTIVPSAGNEQAVDMNVTHATLLGAVYGGNVEGTQIGGMLYPLSKKEHTLEHLRDVAHLRPRGQIHAAAMRIRHCMAYATHHFFHSHGFLYVHTPIITGADCEGAGEQFGITTMLGADHLKPDIVIPVHKAPEPTEEKPLSKSEMKRLAKAKSKGKAEAPKEEEAVVGAIDYSTDFFAQRVNLTVSGQLNVETHACALSDVYTFGPTFRAEESRTYRHLSEFWMIEPEIAFADLTDDINLAEDYLKYCVKFALENCADDLEFFENNEHGEVGLRDRLRNVMDNEFKVRGVNR